MATAPRTPRTILTMLEWSFRGGMKSITHTSPLEVSNVVSTISVCALYCRRVAFTLATGAIFQNPWSLVPSNAAKHAPDENVGQHNQSIDPSRETSAAVSQSPIRQ